jgi:ribosomal protein L36
MKVRASVKKRSPSAKLCVEKEIYVINKRILDLNKDKDSYGKNSRGRYPKKIREVL